MSWDERDEDYEAMDAIELLEEKGPTLGRPAVGRIKASLLRRRSARHR